MALVVKTVAPVAITVVPVVKTVALVATTVVPAALVGITVVVTQVRMMVPSSSKKWFSSIVVLRSSKAVVDSASLRSSWSVTAKVKSASISAKPMKFLKPFARAPKGLANG